MTSSPARRLILAYGAISALAYLVALLPGPFSLPDETGQVFFGIVIQVLILRWLWRGSSAAWVLALGFDLLTILSLVLMGVEGELQTYMFLAAAVAHVMILVSRPLRAHVWSRPKPRAALG